MDLNRVLALAALILGVVVTLVGLEVITVSITTTLVLVGLAIAALGIIHVL